jgi:hypothetical protein
MIERPILFNGPMVRALLDGRKTQTRRFVKPQFEREPVDVVDGVPSWDAPTNYDGEVQMNTTRGKPCPYGVPGDRLWVREAWRSTSDLDANSGSRIAELCLDAGYRSPWAPIRYEADTTQRNWEHTSTPPHDREPAAGRYRHARFMPRWASRITLEVTGVRVERLQDISEADAQAEGVELSDDQTYPYTFAFATLWDQLNGDDAWSADPWVWVVEFKRVSPAAA